MCRSYEWAKQLWEKAPEFKNGGGRRGLVNKYEREKSVFMEHDDICFQYHQTVLVRWVNEHTVIVNHHDSRSSRVFIDRFLPSGLNAYPLGWHTTVNGVEPKSRHTTWRFQPDKNMWEVDLSTAHIRTDVVVDRKIAARAKKKLAPYRNWLQTVENLRDAPMVFPVADPSTYLMNELRVVLEGPEISPKQFWERFNVPDLDVYAATALGAVKTVDLEPNEFPGKSRYHTYANLIQDK
jgi:hypothetical protein